MHPLPCSAVIMGLWLTAECAVSSAMPRGKTWSFQTLKKRVNFTSARRRSFVLRTLPQLNNSKRRKIHIYLL